MVSAIKLQLPFMTDFFKCLGEFFTDQASTQIENENGRKQPKNIGKYPSKSFFFSIITMMLYTKLFKYNIAKAKIIFRFSKYDRKFPQKFSSYAAFPKKSARIR